MGYFNDYRGTCRPNGIGGKYRIFCLGHFVWEITLHTGDGAARYANYCVNRIATTKGQCVYHLSSSEVKISEDFAQAWLAEQDSLADTACYTTCMEHVPKEGVVVRRK